MIHNFSVDDMDIYTLYTIKNLRATQVIIIILIHHYLHLFAF